MAFSLLQEADLSAPYWQPWSQWFTPVPDLTLAPPGQVAEYLNQRKPHSLAKLFVHQDKLPTGMAYESYIAEADRIPTRDGLHDFFNGLCWFAFPRTKSLFNRLHQEQIAQLGTQARGRLRDMLTVIDENGFLIQAPDELWNALKAKHWQKAFVELRPLWQETTLMVFGHALLEKLTQPYKAITAHALRIPNDLNLGNLDLKGVQGEQEGLGSNLLKRQLDVIQAQHHPTPHALSDINAPQTFQSHELSALDAYLAQQLSASYLVTKPYIPIQIFGIPGWSAEQNEVGFYEDTQVFRPPR